MPETFTAQEEESEQVRDHANRCNSIMLCIIAPFAPLRVGPKRSVFAHFSFSDEFVIEDFIEKVAKLYPEKKQRPPLHILLHSPGGTMSTSYVTSKVLRENFNEVVAYVPHIAASGATILALSCNKVIFGNISRLTGINPLIEMENGIFSPLSLVRAYDSLEGELATMDEDDIPYSTKHLLSTITASSLDEATHTLDLADRYTRDLMKKAGYTDELIHKVLHGVLYDIDAHEEVILFERAKELGIKVQHFEENGQGTGCWDVAKTWLHQYYLKPSPTHVIKYCLPNSGKKGNNINRNKNHKIKEKNN